MKVVIFLGPSLDTTVARALLDADYRPPVQQGDVLRALLDGPDVIGIVDGYFHTVPSVWHKEILAALAQGVHVFGASSMGALRAAELHAFGMNGVGKVFEWFRDGVLEDDDEVAVVHGPAESGYREQSVAMVNVRDLVEAAEVAGVVGAEAAAEIVRAAKELYYADRTYPAIFEAARRRGTSAEAIDALARFRASYGPSLKQRDAVIMLDAIRSFVAGAPGRHQPAFQLENTLLLEAVRNEVELARAARLPGAYDGDDARLVAGGQRIKFLRKKVLTRKLALEFAERLGIAIADDEVQEMANAFRRQFGLVGKGDMVAWMEAEGLGVAEFTEVMREFCAVKKMEQLFVHEIDRRVPTHLRVNSARDWQKAHERTPSETVRESSTTTNAAASS